MAGMEVAVRRPRRWDQPFDASMTDDDVDRLLDVDPFAQIDASLFPDSLSLRGILRNDASLRKYSAGDIVVRAGDYGSSAFMVVHGAVQVVLTGLSDEDLGRPAPARTSWLRLLWRLLWQPSAPETRPISSFDPIRIRGKTAQPGGRDLPRIFLQDVPRVLADAETTKLGEGEIFGELAAMTRTPRAATVIADGEATLMEIRWQGLRELIQRSAPLRGHIEQLYRQHSLQLHLRETPLLANLPAERLQAVAEATQFETHGGFDWYETFNPAVRRRPGDAIVDEPLIVEEGSPADGLLLVRAGFARVSRRFGSGHRTLSYLGKGRTFGLAEAIAACGDAPTVWKHSLRALGYVDVLRIPIETLVAHVMPYVSPDEIEAALQEQTAAIPATQPNGTSTQSATSSADAVPQGLVEFLFDRRLVNGREAMAIDLDRCTRCDDCVRACAATHNNNPRFIRTGPRHGPLMIAQACMHCVDPVCMIGCPTGAIGWDGTSGVVRINDLTCIGCATCAESCPYDNIQMVEARSRRGTILVDEATGQPIAKATKCDLCADLPGGPACQNACPHDALVRLDLGEIAELSAWMHR